MPDAMPYRNTALQLARNYLKCISGSDIVGAALLSARIDRVKPVFDETLGLVSGFASFRERDIGMYTERQVCTPKNGCLYPE